MKTKSCIRAMALFIGFLMIALPAHLAAQSTGRVEFVALVAPTGGQPEPVRQLTFYLLRKSVEDIRKETLQTAPAPDLEKFIDGLDVSPELKAWMEKHHSVRLSGEEFTKSLTPGDIMDIPEYFKAYMTHNEAYRGAGFPEPKFKEKDLKSNPEKYQAKKEEYKAAVRKFIGGAPSTVQGMDLELIDLNPYPRWTALEGKQSQNVARPSIPAGRGALPRRTNEYGPRRAWILRGHRSRKILDRHVGRGSDFRRRSGFIGTSP